MAPVMRLPWHLVAGTHSVWLLYLRQFPVPSHVPSNPPLQLVGKSFLHWPATAGIKPAAMGEH
jgi:hypothetical protein